MLELLIVLIQLKLFLAKEHYENYEKYASVDKVKNKNNLLEAYNTLAYYWVQHDDLEKAKLYYELILELDPADANAIDALKLLKANR